MSSVSRWGSGGESSDGMESGGGCETRLPFTVTESSLEFGCSEEMGGSGDTNVAAVSVLPSFGNAEHDGIGEGESDAVDRRKADVVTSSVILSSTVPAIGVSLRETVRIWSCIAFSARS